MTELPFHPVADIFPLMEGEEFDALKADIKATGLIYGIWTYQGQIIDGRNRYRACQELGVEPVLREWNGEGSLVDFVRSLNLARRHLTPSQRAVAAALALPFYEREAAERQKAAGQAQGHRGKEGGRGKKKDKPLVQLFEQGVSSTNGRAPPATEEAAQKFKTNRQYVADAKRVVKEAPELAEKIRQGGMTLAEAREQLPPKTPRKKKPKKAAIADDPAPAEEPAAEEPAPAPTDPVEEVREIVRSVGIIASDLTDVRQIEAIISIVSNLLTDCRSSLNMRRKTHGPRP